MSIHVDNLFNLEPADQSQHIRLELKEWEKAFEACNGRKASREDIKNNADIARKYKFYNKLRTSSSHPSKSSPATSRPPPPPTSSARTPQKRKKDISYLHPSIIDPYDPPLSALKKTPTVHRISIGPTPQKDGRVLGIFDLLSPASDRIGTPSKQGRSSLNPIHGNSLKTPSKKRHLDASQDGNTPSSRKRPKPSPRSAPNPTHLFTPSAHRNATPGYRKVGLDDTPAFLKRYSQPACTFQSANGEPSLEYKNGTETSWSPEINVRMRTKPAGKGLSALVRGLREMADEQLDEEMDLIREMEGGGGARSSSNFTAKIAAAAASMRKGKEKIEVSVKDSPGPPEIEMPLGPDRGLSESEEAEATLATEGKGSDGKPPRVWKKRGQKRSTRTTVMRPTKAKWKPEPKWNGGDNDSDAEIDNTITGEVAVVPETQLLPTIVAAPDDDDFLHTDNEENAAFRPDADADEAEEEEEEEEENPSFVTRPKKPAKQTKERLEESEQQLKNGEEKREENKKERKEKKEKKKKKIAPTAHANFRALKIRGKGAGGKGGARYARSGRGR